MSDLSSRIIGPLLLANLINWGLYGLFVLQSYIYLTTSPKFPLSRANNDFDNVAITPLTHIRTDVEYAAAALTSPTSPSATTNNNSHSSSPMNPRIPHQKLILSFIVFLLFILQTVQLLLGTVYIYWLSTNAPMDLTAVNDPVKMRLIITAACIIGPIVYIFVQLILAYRIYLICTVPLLTLFSQQNNRKSSQSPNINNNNNNNSNIYHIKKSSHPSHLPNPTQPQSQNQHIYPPQSSFITFSRSNSNLGIRVFLNRPDFKSYLLWLVFISLILAVAFCGVARGAQLLGDLPTYEHSIPLTPTAGFWLVGTVAINLVVFVYFLAYYIHSGALDISKPTTVALRVLGESGFAQLVLSVIALVFAAADTPNQSLVTTSAMFSVFLLLPGVYNNTALLSLTHSYAHMTLRTPYGSGLQSNHQRVHKPSTASSTAIAEDFDTNMLRERGSKSKLRNGYAYPSPTSAPDQEWNCVPASDFRRGVGIGFNVGIKKSDGTGNNFDNGNPNFGTKGMFRRRKSKSVSKVTGKNPSDRFMCGFVTRMGMMGSSVGVTRPRPRHAKRGSVSVSVSRRMSQRTFSDRENRVSGGTNRAGQDGNRVLNIGKRSWVRLGADAFNNFGFKGSEKEKEAYPEWDSSLDESVERDRKRPNVVGVDADGVITLDLRKMSVEHETGRNANVDTITRKHPPEWIELQRDVNGSGSGAGNGNANVNDATGVQGNKSSSEADMWKRGEREDPNARRRPKGPRSSAAGTSFNAQILRDLQTQGSFESFDDLPVFRARPGYGSGSEWETDYDDEFWSDDDAGSDVDARVATPVHEEFDEANSTWSSTGVTEEERQRIMQQTGLSWIPAQQRPNFRSLMSLPNQSISSRPNPAAGARAPAAQRQVVDDSSIMIISAVPEPSFVEPSVFRAASVAATRASTGSEWSSWTYPKPTALPDLDEDLQDGILRPADGDSTRAHPSTPSKSFGSPVGLADGDYEGGRDQEASRRWRVHPLQRMVEMGRLKW